ncbi:unnamed protein product [Parnassius apollo]|uniref:(apollo) hypothetical protein n=1 Tax=Parnassius apollo TaxID=110799 RepID=A0A8S3XC44_PARAO|nr:unnamed protein product [Parnassius apollo]
MKCEPFQSPSIASELEISTPKVELLESQLQAGIVDDRNLTLKLSRRANYLMDRLARISESSSHLSDLRSRLIRILSVINGEDSDTDSEYKETQAQPPNQKVESEKVIYVKDKPLNLNTFNLKFDGTTCVRVFIERLEELKEARNITEARILSAFSDLLENSALCVDFWQVFDLGSDLVSEVQFDRKSESPISNSINSVSLKKGLEEYESLSIEQKQIMDNLIQQFDTINTVKVGLGRTNLIHHVIDTGDSKPIKQRYYPLSPVKQQALEKELDRMLSLGVVSPSQSASTHL